MRLPRSCPVGCPLALSPGLALPLEKAGFGRLGDATPLPAVSGSMQSGGGQ
jgi:hypothetical protein